MTLKNYRPVPGGLEPREVEDTNWRRRLRSPRWRAAELKNPEGEITSPTRGALVFLALAAGTFIVLVLGYGTGFWGT